MRKYFVFFLLAGISNIFSIFFSSQYISPIVHAYGWCAGGWAACSTTIDPGCTGDTCLQIGSEAVRTAVWSKLSDETITEYAVRIAKYFLSFVSLIAVFYILYAGFRILTSAGDEEKTKTARKIIMYVIAGIIVMWLAYWIVEWIIKALDYNYINN